MTGIIDFLGCSVLLSSTLKMWGKSGLLSNFTIFPTGCGGHSVSCCFLCVSASRGVPVFGGVRLLQLDVLVV